MALHYNFFDDTHREPPDHLAHKANDAALRHADAHKSHENLENKIRRHLNASRPTEDSNNHSIILYFLLALGWLVGIFVEYDISIEIYQLHFQNAAPLVILFCLAIELYASSCLSEGTKQFRISSQANDSKQNWSHGDADHAIETIYDRSRKRTSGSNWAFHPVTGMAVSCLLLFCVYQLSVERVELLRQAGEVMDGTMATWLPLIIIAVRIFLGMPTFFIVQWTASLLNYRRLQKNLTQARDFELTLRRGAITDYMSYVATLNEYNKWADGTGRNRRLLIPANPALRTLLAQDEDFDPGNVCGDTTGDTSRPVDDGGGNPGTHPNQQTQSDSERNTIVSHDGPGYQYHESQSQDTDLSEDQLLDLDEQIERRNRSIDL